MKTFEINIPPNVENEIESYVDHIAKDSIKEALKWYEKLKDKIYSLDQNPMRCPYADENEFHDYEIKHLIFGNYRILFRIENTTVQILHIKHGRMNRVPLE